jgi:hypothetical protein
MKQDEAETDSDAAPDFESMFDVCQAETKSQEEGFFNVGNMHPEPIPSAKTQSNGCNCDVYTSPSWLMSVAVERTNPGLWTKIETLSDLDKEIVKPFWDLHENKEDHMINFQFRICWFMQFFLDKHVVKKQRSLIAVGGHLLPDNWVYSKSSDMQTCRCHHVPEYLFQPLMPERRTVLLRWSKWWMTMPTWKSQTR